MNEAEIRNWVGMQPNGSTACRNERVLIPIIDALRIQLAERDSELKALERVNAEQTEELKHLKEWIEHLKETEPELDSTWGELHCWQEGTFEHLNKNPD